MTACSNWACCQGGINDITNSMMQYWTSDSIVPIGESSSFGGLRGVSARWSSDTVDAIYEELKGLASDDPMVIELTTEFVKEMVTELPYLTTENEFADNYIFNNILDRMANG